MTASVIAFSERGFALGQRVVSCLERRGGEAELTRCPEHGLDEWARLRFGRDALIFIGSCGIAVRAVAPLVKSKTDDPAVVVIDERASFAVSLLSGHIGGANRLAKALAHDLGAVPVVTTATDLGGVFAIDEWAARHGLRIINPERIKSISARLLAGGAVRLQSDFPVTGALPAGISLCSGDGDALISVRAAGDAASGALRLVPPVLALGVGCRRDTPAGALEEAFARILEAADCHPLSVAGIYSIDLKAREPGILEFCRLHGLPYKTFSAGELEAAPGAYAASAFVRRVTGTDSVCERAAALGAGEGGRLIAGKLAHGGVTMALGLSPYTVSFEDDEENEG